MNVLLLLPALAIAASADLPMERARAILEEAAAVHAGDRVHESGYGAGRVFEVFPNGTALVKYDHTRQDRTRPVGRLAKARRCQAALCVGDRVDDGGRPGRLAELFSDGTARIDYDGTREEALRPAAKLKEAL
jgi:hypothetical protein